MGFPKQIRRHPIMMPRPHENHRVELWPLRGALNAESPQKLKYSNELGPQHIHNYANIFWGKSSNKYFCFWGIFIKLRACNVSVAASGVFVHVGQSFFSSQKLSDEARGAQPSWNSERKLIFEHVFFMFLVCFVLQVVTLNVFYEIQRNFLYI